MKKFLSGVVAACVVASCLSVTAIADDASAAPAPAGSVVAGEGGENCDTEDSGSLGADDS